MHIFNHNFTETDFFFVWMSNIYIRFTLSKITHPKPRDRTTNSDNIDNSREHSNCHVAFLKLGGNGYKKDGVILKACLLS
jgi:hypothetical protein